MARQAHQRKAHVGTGDRIDHADDRADAVVAAGADHDHAVPPVGDAIAIAVGRSEGVGRELVGALRVGGGARLVLVGKQVEIADEHAIGVGP